MHPFQPITTLMNKPHRPGAGQHAAAHPYVQDKLQPVAPSPFVSRLARTTWPLPNQPAQYRLCPGNSLDAYATLVSAACYLRGAEGDLSERQAARDICLDLAERVHKEAGEGAGLGGAAEQARRAKEQQWERYTAVSAALRFLTNPDRPAVTPSLQRESRWVRWRRGWQGAKPMHVF